MRIQNARVALDRYALLRRPHLQRYIQRARSIELHTHARLLERCKARSLDRDPVSAQRQQRHLILTPITAVRRPLEARLQIHRLHVRMNNPPPEASEITPRMEPLTCPDCARAPAHTSRPAMEKTTKYRMDVPSVAAEFMLLTTEPCHFHDCRRGPAGMSARYNERSNPRYKWAFSAV